MVIKKLSKRDGRIVDFDQERITNAIYKAAQAVGGHDRSMAQKVSDLVIKELERIYKGKNVPTVEHVQDIVEKMLIEEGHARTAKAYIIYRLKHRELRDSRALVIGKYFETKLSSNSLRVLKERYLRKDKQGKIVETPDEMFRRVAKNIAQAELKYDPNFDVKSLEDQFYQLMNSLTFLPNSPTLMNAGLELQQLSACYVLPVEDSMEGIFDSIKYAALIHKSGGGTGFSFSRLRPRNDMVLSTKGVSSGPISFMKVFDAATEVIKQGGKRRGANMGILRVDHPDILDFIIAKEKNDQINNFNISVAITEDFMKAVENDEDYALINPRDKKPIKTLSAKKVFNLLTTLAWKNGDPGIVFIDRINKDNPTPQIGEIESTNPCGEQPLLPFEACNLGSINLAKFVKDGKYDFEAFGEIIDVSIRFLDDVIDMNNYPLKQIDEIVKGNRKIGLGVMGWADTLVMMGIPYNSDEGVKFAEKIAEFFKERTEQASAELAKIRGTFPNWKGSLYEKRGLKVRNATQRTIAPTGTIGMIADCSGGVEPLFALAYKKVVMDGQELLYVDRNFEEQAKAKGIYSEELMMQISKSGSVQHISEVPEDLRKVFVVSHDITPIWHTKMQGAWQKYVDNAVSKTVNFPNDATIEDVQEVYMLAYKLGCKGVTIYRDGSRDTQVLNLDISSHQEGKKPVEKIQGKKCPECGEPLYMSEGCAKCMSCGYSACAV